MKEDNITKELQKKELDILKSFINVCDKIGVNYFLIGGTLIGAVRHNGFIPWDDDIDVCMLRDDYEKFLAEGQKFLNNNYFLQTYNTDKDYPVCFAKIRDSETTFVESSLNLYDINHGIYIDIFPLDSYHKINKCKERLLNYSLLSRLLKKEKKVTRKLTLFISNVVYGRKSKLELCNLKENMYKSYVTDKTDLVTNYCGAWGIKKETHRKCCFDNYKVVKFEGVNVKIPIGFDEILKNTYGDYMKLPPKEKQISHHYSDIIDTKKSYKKYLKSKGDK